MPHRRKSFRDLDELVKLVPDERPARTADRHKPRPDGDAGNVHDRLFERAWRRPDTSSP